MKRRSLVVLFLLLMVSMPSSSGATLPSGSSTCLIFNVPSRSTGWRPLQISSSLQASIYAAHPGETLVVSGTCVGVAKIDKDLTVQGLGGHATLDAQGGGTVLATYTGDTVTLRDLTVTNGGAGGIDNLGGTLTLVRTSVIGNSSFQSGGGIVNYGTLTLDHSVVSDNTTPYVGGGILNADTQSSAGTVTLVDSTISGNAATGSGGGIYNTTGTVTMTGSTLSGNSADDGGGIFNRGKLTIAGSTVSGNSANDSGGGIYDHPSGSTTITNATVSGNTAVNDGGGALVSGNLTLVTSIVRGNSAYGRGGAIMTSDGGTTTVRDSTVADNTAQLGAITNFGSTVAITNTIVSGNASGLFGAGIANLYTGVMTVIDSTVRGNSAYEGGGIFNGSIVGFTVARSTVTGNHASTDGGGISNVGAMILTDSNVTNNTSASGGGISNRYGNFTLNNTSVSGNHAQAGGGIYILSGGPFTVTGATAITGNAPDNCYPPGLIPGCTG